MDSKTCLQCGKILKPNRRGVFCGRRCVWRAWHQRSIARGYEAQNLPLAMPPPNSEPILPAMGPERLRAANQLALIARAPADARGYRVGIQPGHQQLMRWFPPARFRAPAMFLLDPFEGPAVPTQGTYAVVYLDGRCLPLGGPLHAGRGADRPAASADQWRPDLQAAASGVKAGRIPGVSARGINVG